MKKKRLLTLVGSVCLILVLASLPFMGACAKPAPAPAPVPTPAPPPPPAPAREYILIGHPVPLTGAIAPFGEGAEWAVDRITSAINKDGGIFIKELGKKLPVKVIIVDTESDPSKAAALTRKLILDDKVDLIVANHTPDTGNPASATSEKFETPCICSVVPVEPWLTGGPYKWSFDAFWSVEDILDVYTGIWEEFPGEVNKVVGFFFSNDPDGVVWAEHFTERLPKMDYKIVDMGRFPYGMEDFSSFINTWKKEKVEIITGVPIPPDFATLWRQCYREGFVPKIATIGKAVLFPAAVEAIGGDLPLGLTTEVWWTPSYPYKSSLTGWSSKKLAEEWTKETGKLWTQPLAYEYASFEIAIDALKRSGSLEKSKIREALVQTDLETLVGHIKFDERHVAPTALVGGQWVKGDEKWPWKLEIVHNAEYPEIPITGEAFLIK